MENKKENKYKKRGKILWIYSKYILITRLLLTLGIIPLYSSTTKLLISASGRATISSGDFWHFIFSFYGIVLVVLTIFILAIMVGIDINAFIIISALVHEEKLDVSVFKIFFLGLKSSFKFLKPTGVIILLYVALCVPLIKLGYTVSPMKNFSIPNFIMSVINENILYSLLYYSGIALIIYTSIKYIFVFNYLVIANMKTREALRHSKLLFRKYWKKFLVEFGLKYLILKLISIFGIFFLTFLFNLPSLLPISGDAKRIVTIFFILLLFEIIMYLATMDIPILTTMLTKLFYKYNEDCGIGYRININTKNLCYDKFSKIKRKTKISIAFSIIGILVVNLILSVFLTKNFNDIFKYNDKISIIAHRGGGDLAAENSLLGIKKAWENGASYSEIDIQRTKDNHYIINHDTTFSRLSNVREASYNLNLEEIKKLRIKDLFNTARNDEPIASLDEALLFSRGKIGLYIELKGVTADKKMADDVISLVEKYGMTSSSIIISLDYNLIKYVEEKYPHITTGFIYYFSYGNIGKMVADVLIMEEAFATDENISKIHEVGKKAVVWTVNKPSSIEKFVLTDVDGIITDRIKAVFDGIKKRDERNDSDIILDELIRL